MNTEISPLVETSEAAPGPRAFADSPPAVLVGSFDAYSGLVMFLTMAEMLEFCHVAHQAPGSTFWDFLCHHQSHVEWVGCSLHDTIQRSFSFLVGVAMPFSLASSRARGQSRATMTVHAVW
jgi:predicted acyltransferase